MSLIFISIQNKFDIDINNDELLENNMGTNKILKVDHHLWCAITWNPSFIFKVIMNKHFYVDKQFVVHQFIHLEIFNLLSIEIRTQIASGNVPHS
jgi:hypothetical protein